MLFLNPDMMEEAEDGQTKTILKQPQIKQRFANNRFQAKGKEEVKVVESSQVSRIKQKEEQQQQKQVVEAPVENQVIVVDELHDDGILDFNSDSEELVSQNVGYQDTYQQKLQSTQQYQQNKQMGISVLQKNDQYSKKLGQNQSAYEERNIDYEKITYIGNNNNQYHEPGIQYKDDGLPQLRKDETRRVYEQSALFRQQEPIQQQQQQQQSIPQQQPLQSFVKFQDEGDSEEDYEHQKSDEYEFHEENQQEEMKKEHKQLNDKVQMEDVQVDEVENEQQQQQQQPTQPLQKQLSPYPKAFLEIPMPQGKKYFLTHPCPRGGMIQCTIKRDRSGMARFYPKYHLHISNGFLYLMSAKKRAYNNTSNYIISLAREDMQKEANYIGKVRSNFMGTEFTLYDSGKNPKKTKDPQFHRQQLGVVFYESNIMGTKGPRKMKVIVPAVDEKTNEMYQYRPNNSKEGMMTDYRYGKFEHLIIQTNRPPQWNSKHKAFVLNFYQRVDKPSVKNFQLVVEGGEDNILLQFGRVGEDLFNLDFQWPLSPMQAFQIALSSFDYKIACE